MYTTCGSASSEEAPSDMKQERGPRCLDPEGSLDPDSECASPRVHCASGCVSQRGAREAVRDTSSPARKASWRPCPPPYSITYQQCLQFSRGHQTLPHITNVPATLDRQIQEPLLLPGDITSLGVSNALQVFITLKELSEWHQDAQPHGKAGGLASWVPGGLITVLSI